MPRFLFDFKCDSCGAVEEHIVDTSVKQICHPHPECEGQMTRLISPVRTKLDGLDPGFPDAYDKWSRQHEKAGRAPVEQ